MTSISAGGRSERNKDFQGEKNKKAAIIKTGRQSKEGKISHARQVIKKKKSQTQTGDPNWRVELETGGNRNKKA